MTGQSNIFRGSPGQTRRSVPRRSLAFLALILALALASAGGAPRAQAAPAGQWSGFFLVRVVGKPRTLLCARQIAHYNVKIEFEQPTNTLPRPTPVPGFFGGMPVVNINVMASSSNKNAGDFTNHNALTTVAAADDLSGLLVATFDFKAGRPGTTTLKFEAEVQGEMISTELSVKVRKCNFKTTTTGQWQVPGPAGIFIAATSGDAEVSAADADGQFTGSTSVNWVASTERVEDCTGTITIGSSRVDWTGAMDDNGQLTLDGTFQTAAGAMDALCVGGGESTGGSLSIDLTPDPLQFTIASSGGATSQFQVLQGPEAMSGTVTIIVVPVEDQAAAFDPGAVTAGWQPFASRLNMLSAAYEWAD